ncbi:MAG: ATP-binding cassette domain-containing protein [Gammaproteobacteria bacterium]|nr:ATP-binding cassette domain-containing protein [Gammaproteobacteria bacterium]
MIKVESISRLYGNFKAVDDVSFNIEKGEIVGLLGHNGAGKTTIMKLLTGYLEADSGSILVNGHDIADDPEIVQTLIGYLPENLPLYQEMSIIDYLDYVAELRGLSGKNKFDAIRNVIDQTELQAKAFQTIATLSRGFKQRVGVAQAILHRPSVLILDEPTNGLDPTQTQHMRRLIKQCAEDAIIILSTHIMQEVDALCDRVLILNNGKLDLDERLATLQASHALYLETDVTEDVLIKILSDLNEVEMVEFLESQTGCNSYSLHMVDQTDARLLIASVVNRISSTGKSVYTIKTQKHNLESVFRQVSVAKDASDAA